MAEFPLLEETARFWQGRTSRQVTVEDARQMVETVAGFFRTLQRWSDTADGRQSKPDADEEAA